VSGAVLLLPFHASVLGTPNLSVTPTNLPYHMQATHRYGRPGQSTGRLAAVLIAGTVRVLSLDRTVGQAAEGHPGGADVNVRDLGRGVITFTRMSLHQAGSVAPDSPPEKVAGQGEVRAGRALDLDGGRRPALGRARLITIGICRAW
jgi:hypothetical protein